MGPSKGKPLRENGVAMINLIHECKVNEKAASFPNSLADNGLYSPTFQIRFIFGLANNLLCKRKVFNLICVNEVASMRNLLRRRSDFHQGTDVLLK